MNYRKTSQYLLPEIKPPATEGSYDIYPSFRLEAGTILTGFDALAKLIAGSKNVTIEGYGGVFFTGFRDCLDTALAKIGLKPVWYNSADYLKSPHEIDEMITPFLGGDDPLFGRRTDLRLIDFFTPGLSSLKPAREVSLNIIIGPGASLAGWDGLLLYIDLPKNEIQFRSRAGSITNLGASGPSSPKEMYKRFYFVDWPVLNRWKKELLPHADVLIDGQHPDNPAFITGGELRNALKAMSCSPFRARPWFEPGTWGGTWIKSRISGLSGDVPNYAWSFELISPENGILLESRGRLLEFSFDTLMYLEGSNILGNDSGRFGHEFPIRFDFLDTFDGGNLSIQCHPQPGYARNNFGENITQEETYYILDAKEDAKVYLGFREDIEPVTFRNELERSFNTSVPVEIERFVQVHPASKHDLFLIPPGTIHGSGRNNLVLEISTTPYIFTFKMYDWLRPDLDGKPRQLNIARGMENLVFEYRGDYVTEKLISVPRLLEQGEGWEKWLLPTHESHSYIVHRYVITSYIEIMASGKCHVLSLVEGTPVKVIAGSGAEAVFSYAETFIIPAAAGSYRIISPGGGKSVVVAAFMKDI